MKRSQTAKISKKEIVTFINEEDRQKFCRGIALLLKDPELIKAAREKQAKHKTFTIKVEVAEFKDIGLDPFIRLHFKQVKNTDELDLDIDVKRKENAALNEYFDLSSQV